MKTHFVVVLSAAPLIFAQAVFAQNGTTAAGAPAPGVRTGCVACAQRDMPEAVTARVVPGTNETVLVGRIENVIPIGVLAALGCEKCASEAVAWALKQGSSTDDIGRAIRALAAMQTLDCFKQQFGNDAAARLEKPLAAARLVLQQAIDQGGGK